ncbi:hypothetical protein PMIN01_01705 [Paraphaeosphaeria minitans]|uniref:Uncharacterized protein n=1 Tax=Paraphaeosphaeria minitans TaxID=565426 RepID=A0A9P6GNT7_9PLEO|nr:hypothetical protein PMIN01_01705 [Paraphaeosphaeria minitans]
MERDGRTQRRAHKETEGRGQRGEALGCAATILTRHNVSQTDGRKQTSVKGEVWRPATNNDAGGGDDGWDRKRELCRAWAVGGALQRSSYSASRTETPAAQRRAGEEESKDRLGRQESRTEGQQRGSAVRVKTSQTSQTQRDQIQELRVARGGWRRRRRSVDDTTASDDKRDAGRQQDATGFGGSRETAADARTKHPWATGHGPWAIMCTPALGLAGSTAGLGLHRALAAHATRFASGAAPMPKQRGACGKLQ